MTKEPTISSTLLGIFGNYQIVETFQAAIKKPKKVVGQSETGEDVTETMVIKHTEKKLKLQHTRVSDSKVTFTIKKIGQRITIKDDRNKTNKKIENIESVKELARMTGLSMTDAALMMSPVKSQGEEYVEPMPSKLNKTNAPVLLPEEYTAML
jgi:hypothetical protein